MVDDPAARSKANTCFCDNLRASRSSRKSLEITIASYLTEVGPYPACIESLAKTLLMVSVPGQSSKHAKKPLNPVRSTTSSAPPRLSSTPNLHSRTSSAQLSVPTPPS
jgi:hypothetical protein